MKKRISLFFCISVFFCGYTQQNFKAWSEKMNNEYEEWNKKQKWDTAYFQWKNETNEAYNTWAKENGWEESSNNNSQAVENISTFIDQGNEVSNVNTPQPQILDYQNQIEQLQNQNTTANINNQEEIERLQNQIAALQRRNEELAQQQQQQTGGTFLFSKIKIWAVIVGISEYKKESSKLRFCDDDAYKMYGFLRSPEGGAVPKSQIALLIDEDASGKKIKEALRNVSQKAGSEDIFLFYYSGHGSPNYLMGNDYSETNSGYISHQFIKNQLKSSKAKFTYCILDACHSGSVITDTKNKSIASLETSTQFYTALNHLKKGNVFIVSSKSKETSVEVSGKRQGVFSYYFTNALNGEADYNKDKIISITEAFDYTRKNVILYTNNKQTPLMSGSFNHTMPISFIRK